MGNRIAIFAYGVVVYALFLATFVYAVGFVGGFAVSPSLDSVREGGLLEAILVDLGLLTLFAVQHSVMARPAFKRWWTRVVPEAAERSTYVLFSSLALAAMFALWRPLGGVVWTVEAPVGQAVLWALFGTGWALVLVATFLIDHFDLFGLRQVWLHLRGMPYRPRRFVTPGPYRVVRHPLYVGWLLAFWATPTMTSAHLLFAVMTTAYILVAIQLEERDLTAALPEYASYRDRVPMLVPRLRSRVGATAAARAAA
ncbi:MAG: isoprenylcysteine carboxylmethyltransferase family protein [Ectothiorhodospiraceae bacterium]|nr:isoprenylcysteine carboxylmethyltransferase family protein [Ectothiorhodospiraceae bacterium]